MLQIISRLVLGLQFLDIFFIGGHPKEVLLPCRRQSHTYFTFSVGVTYAPTEEGEEAGVTIFLTQDQHIDLGIVLLSSEGKFLPHVRFQTTLLNDLNTPGPKM